MSRESSVAKRYANALYSVVSRDGRSAAINRDLQAVADLFTSNKELASLIAARTVPTRKKREVVDAIFVSASGVADEVRRLMSLLADKDRLGQTANVAAAFAARVMVADKALAAQVVTAVALTDDRKRALEAALGQATGRTVTVEGAVDPSIVGGVVARVGGMVFDASLASQLERLRQRLAASV